MLGEIAGHTAAPLDPLAGRVQGRVDPQRSSKQIAGKAGLPFEYSSSSKGGISIHHHPPQNTAAVEILPEGGGGST